MSDTLRHSPEPRNMPTPETPTALQIATGKINLPYADRLAKLDKYCAAIPNPEGIPALVEALKAAYVELGPCGSFRASRANYEIREKIESALAKCGLKP